MYKFSIRLASIWLVFVLAPTLVQAETFLIDGRADEAHYDSVLYLEHVDISIVEVNEQQRRAQSTALQPNTIRQTLQLGNAKWYISTAHTKQLQRYEAIRPVKIGIIDTGIAQDFLTNGDVIAGPNFITGAALPIDDHGHGTGLASVMQDVIGAIPIELIAIKAANANGTFTVDNIVKAIDYAIANELDILNLSFGATTPHTLEQQAIDKAIAAGITVISSSGNNGQRVKYYPSSYPNVYSIGSINELLQRSHFSTYNELLDFVAPGEAMVVRRHNMFTTTLVEGTSFASAYFSAVFGVTKVVSNVAHADSLTAAATDLGAAGFDAEYGHGYVDPLQAVLTFRGIPWAQKTTNDPLKAWTIHFSQPIVDSPVLQQLTLMNEQLVAQPIRYTLVGPKTLTITPTEPLAIGTYWIVIPANVQGSNMNTSQYPSFLKFVVEP